MKRGWVWVLMIGIVCGISTSSQAQRYHQAREKHFKNKYRKQIKLNDQVCGILRKRKHMRDSKPLLLAHLFRKKSGYKPQAEVDPPAVQATARATTR
jgi:hypothetical protein